MGTPEDNDAILTEDVETPSATADDRSRRQLRLLTAAVVGLILLLFGTVAAFVYVTRPLQPVNKPAAQDGWTFVSSLTSWGGGPQQQLTQPNGVAYQADGTVLVADTPVPKSVRILAFSGTAAPSVVTTSYGMQPGQMLSAYALATDANGNIYVADPVGARVQVLSSAGKRIREIPSRHPEALFIKGDTLYVGEEGSVARFTLAGNLLGRFGKKGREKGQFDRITGLCVDATGTIYVADGPLNRVQAVDQTGTVIWVTGTAPKSMNETNLTFDFAADVALAADGRLYVLEGLGSQVAVLDPKTGRVLRRLGTRGADDGQLYQPKKMAVNADGTVLAIADTYNDRVQFIRLRPESLVESLTSAHPASGLEGVLGLPLMLCVTALIPIGIVIAVILMRRRIARRGDVT